MTARDAAGQFARLVLPAKRLCGACVLAILCGCTAPDSQPVAGKLEHYTASGFRNLYVQPKDTSFFGFMWMRHFGDDEWASYTDKGHLVPQVATDLQAIEMPGRLPQVTWIGHATVLIQHRGVNILTDPIFSQRASPLSFAGPRRVTQPALTLQELPAIDYVVISHNHYDHLDADSVAAIGDRAQWLTPLGYREWFAEQGVSNVVELDWWQSHSTPQVKIMATPVQHWTGRGLHDRYRALWGGWAVRVGEFNFWFSGDTGYNDVQFKEIGARLGPFDLGIIAVGGYEPRWFMGDMHVNPEESVQIHQDIGARYSIGVHWGTFPLTAEPIDEPPKRLAEAAATLSDTEFMTIAIGETRTIERFKE